MAEEHSPLGESPFVDIGGDVGALSLTTGAEYAGREIEISPLDQPAARVHTAIHERVAKRPIPAAQRP